ncbi:sulfur oxidation c-type cytochrome SoxA [Burkholderiales bacterium]|nr:sulfur oxidation c-type cytochrome SoxA [Burkholderiales bacterium]
MINLIRLGLVICSLGLSHGHADDGTISAVQEYRDLLSDSNPAELWILSGEELWFSTTNPNEVSLEKCDLGKGPGVLKGAYVELPRYFPDVEKVMDLEQRLIHCRMVIQGLSRYEATSYPFTKRGEETSEIEMLVTFIASESKGMRMNIPLNHVAEKNMFDLGKQLFYFRAGSHDFGCITCHSGDNKRIRLQELPNFKNQEQARKTYGSWPAYRVSAGEVRTMQHRLYDCFRQQRFPEATYGDDLMTALIMFLAKSADGGLYNAPAMKR